MQQSLQLPLQHFDPYADNRTNPRLTRTFTNQTKAAAETSRVTFQATASAAAATASAAAASASERRNYTTSASAVASGSTSSSTLSSASAVRLSTTTTVNTQRSAAATEHHSPHTIVHGASPLTAHKFPANCISLHGPDHPHQVRWH